MRIHLDDVDLELRLLDSVDEPPLKVEARGAESLPLTAQSFIPEASDESKTLWATLFSNSLPCFISNADLSWRAFDFLSDGLCLKDPPHMQ